MIRIIKNGQAVGTMRFGPKGLICDTSDAVVKAEFRHVKKIGGFELFGFGSDKTEDIKRNVITMVDEIGVIEPSENNLWIFGKMLPSEYTVERI